MTPQFTPPTWQVACVNIRRATRAEAAALSQLAMAAKAQWGYSAADLDRWRPDLVISEDSIVSLHTYVAERETRPLVCVQRYTVRFTSRAARPA